MRGETMVQTLRRREFVVRVTQRRSKRLGACADTGHFVRSGLQPVACL
jgi:hypothetical protein